MTRPNKTAKYTTKNAEEYMKKLDYDLDQLYSKFKSLICFNKLRVGSTDNYTEIDDEGDVTFVGTGGLAFGEISYMGEGFATTCTPINTYVQVLGFDTDGESNNTTPAHGQDHITVTNAGMYLIQFSVSCRSANSDHYQFMVKTNNGTSDCENIMVHRDVSTAARVGTGACAGICDLSAGDTVELWVKNVDTAGRNIDIEHTTLNVVQIGGT